MDNFYAGLSAEFHTPRCGRCGHIGGAGAFLFGKYARGQWPWRWWCRLFKHRWAKDTWSKAKITDYNPNTRTATIDTKGKP